MVLHGDLNDNITYL